MATVPKTKLQNEVGNFVPPTGKEEQEARAVNHYLKKEESFPTSPFHIDYESYQYVGQGKSLKSWLLGAVISTMKQPFGN